MKLKSILTVLAVAVAAMAQPALAGFTQNEKGEVTHYNGIELPPIPTVEEAKAQAQREIAAAKKAQEAEQAAAASASNLQSEIGNQQFFFTGKPYLEETGQYLFLFRHYDPELARWTTADPSGFPDGANNIAYMAVPTSEFDWQGLWKVRLISASSTSSFTTPSGAPLTGFASLVSESSKGALRDSISVGFSAQGFYHPKSIQLDPLSFLVFSTSTGQIRVEPNGVTTTPVVDGRQIVVATGNDYSSDGRSVTIQVEAAFLRSATQVTGFGIDVLGSGGSISWSGGSDAGSKGIVSLTFESVE